MYKAAVRAGIRRSIRKLNEGNYRPALAMFDRDATLAFPGDNSWARQLHEPDLARRGTEPRVTHRGRDEIEDFMRRYVAHGIQMEIEDIVVNGPPWNLRAAARVHDWALDESGRDVYANRAVLWVRARWGRIVEQEDYEDSERVADWDARMAGVGQGTIGG